MVEEFFSACAMLLVQTCRPGNEKRAITISNSTVGPQHPTGFGIQDHNTCDEPLAVPMYCGLSFGTVFLVGFLC